MAERRLLRLLAVSLLLVSTRAPAYLDLAAARTERLENGLTVIVLEDPSFPVASVQMLYRSGAAEEVSGKTGLAHFLEHMAFRASENFPDTGLVSSIYAVGGEWHGYTWLDQTTYYATAPADQLDLLLRIEADRMARLEIPAEHVAAESGAVLTEMHGYENDPSTVLHDYVLYLSFVAHPYRNNTIGWETDVSGITHADLVTFYERHYQPGNAVLAVVGDVSTATVMQKVRALFADLPGRPEPRNIHTAEPLQRGERRVELHGNVDRALFKMAWRAPSVSSPDYAAFLVAQELLSAGSGVSFLQNDWGTPARPGSALDGITGDLTTWYPPSEEDYVFMVSGSIPATAERTVLETAVQSVIDGLGTRFLESDPDPDPDQQERLAAAKERVIRELVFDVQTTEDAAHQLAFFAGLGAPEVLTGLPEAVREVSAEDVGRVLQSYLTQQRRTTGWYLPASAGQPVLAETTVPEARPARPAKRAAPTPATAADRETPAVTGQLSNGTPVIVKRSTASPTAVLRVVVPDADYDLPGGIGSGVPAWGLVSLDFELLPGELEATVRQARAILDSASAPSVELPVDATDPESLLEHYRRDLLGLRRPDDSASVGPLLLVVTGDVEPGPTMRLLEARFGDAPAGRWTLPPVMTPQTPVEIQAAVLYPVVQERVGYTVQVPGPRPETAAAWRMALYVLSHGYEGRLGKEAISRRGLVYRIGSDYRTDGRNDWITLNIGVDPARREALVALLKEQLAALLTDPPSQAEVDEARVHLLGRFASEAQSNTELAGSLTRQWLWYGEAQENEAWEQQLNAVQRQDILELLPVFTRGSIISVTNPPKPE